MITNATLVWLCVGAIFGFALPVGVLLRWRGTRRARLAPFFVGALVFVVFALGLEPLLHNLCLVQDNAVSRAINANVWLYMLYGSLAAGIFEETGRYVAFRWLLPKRRFPGRETAVTYGVGHGGVEAMLTLGVTYALYAALALLQRNGASGAASALAGGDQAALDALLGVIGALTPAAALLAMAERAAAMLLHIALSVFVFLAARDKTKRAYFPFAIALHAVADMPAALYQRGLLPLAAVELWLWLVALYALRAARKCYLERLDS